MFQWNREEISQISVGQGVVRSEVAEALSFEQLGRTCYQVTKKVVEGSPSMGKSPAEITWDEH